MATGRLIVYDSRLVLSQHLRNGRQVQLFLPMVNSFMCVSVMVLVVLVIRRSYSSDVMVDTVYKQCKT